MRYLPAKAATYTVPAWVDGALQRAVSVDARKRYEALSEFTMDLRRPNPDYVRELVPLAGARGFVPRVERLAVRRSRSKPMAEGVLYRRVC